MAAKHLITVASYWHSFQAEHAKLRLEAEGIRAYVQGDNIVAMYWFYANADRGIKIDVSADDAERAVEILQRCDDSLGTGNTDKESTTDVGETQEDEDSGTLLTGISKRGAFLSMLLVGFPFPFPKLKTHFQLTWKWWVLIIVVICVAIFLKVNFGGTITETLVPYGYEP